MSAEVERVFSRLYFFFSNSLQGKTDSSNTLHTSLIKPSSTLFGILMLISVIVAGVLTTMNMDGLIVIDG